MLSVPAEISLPISHKWKLFRNYAENPSLPPLPSLPLSLPLSLSVSFDEGQSLQLDGSHFPRLTLLTRAIYVNLFANTV
jgi:hypothetical protein